MGASNVFVNGKVEEEKASPETGILAMKKNRTIATRLTEEEYSGLMEDAARLGMSISGLVRLAVIQKQYQKIVPEINRRTYQRLGELQRELGSLEPSEQVRALEDEMRQLRLEMLGLKNLPKMYR